MIQRSSMLALAALSLSACASIVSGTSDDIKVESDPPGASCDIYRSGDLIGHVERTPQLVNVSRTSKTLLFDCEKDGKNGQEKAEAGTNGWTLVNWLTLNIAGVFIDAMTGAYVGYDDDVKVVLGP